MTALIFGSPGRYVQGKGVLGNIGEYIRTCAPKALILCDAYMSTRVGPEVKASCDAHGVQWCWFEFSGELTEDWVRATAGDAARANAGVVVAIGGGKALDAGKALADQSDCRLITVPTAASNDAPTSKNYVLYDDAHQMVAVRHMKKSPDYVVVDTAVLARAPKHFLVAGIGDALTKYFEAEQCMRVHGTNLFGTPPAWSAYVLARECHALLREHAEAVLATLPEPNDARFERLIEATLLMSGLGFESGGLSIAHSMTRGLSKIPLPTSALHGLQVAYALMVQLHLEARPADFVDDLLAFYRRIGLPATLRELGLDGDVSVHFATIARHTLSAPHMRNFERPVSADDLIRAMQAVETGFGAR
ncbi:glycerol dehydrogenase [Burkholderia anthina]|uniref:glycerol dehydrogenase n=1 Tax=Burkholderia anthina TaxID=179879 RepID=UPI00158C1143